MITKIKDFVHTRNGDTLNPLIFTFKQNNEEIDITDYEFFASVNTLEGEEVTYYDMGNGCSIVDNKLVIDFGSEITIAAGRYFFWVKLYNTEVGFQTILEGDFIVDPERVNNR